MIRSQNYCLRNCGSFCYSANEILPSRPKAFGGLQSSRNEFAWRDSPVLNTQHTVLDKGDKELVRNCCPQRPLDLLRLWMKTVGGLFGLRDHLQREMKRVEVVVRVVILFFYVIMQMNHRGLGKRPLRVSVATAVAAAASKSKRSITMKGKTLLFSSCLMASIGLDIWPLLYHGLLSVSFGLKCLGSMFLQTLLYQ